MDRFSRGNSTRTYYVKTSKKFGKKYKYIKYPDEQQHVTNCYTPCEYRPKPEYYDQTAYCPQSPYYASKSVPISNTNSRSTNRQSTAYNSKSTRLTTKAPIRYMTKYPNPLYRPSVPQSEIVVQPEQYRQWQLAQEWQQPQQWQWLQTQQQLQQSQQWQRNGQTQQSPLCPVNQLSQQSEQLERAEQSQQSQEWQQNHFTQQDHQRSQDEQWSVAQLYPSSQASTRSQWVNYMHTPQQSTQQTKFLKEESRSEPEAIKRISPEFMILLKRHEDSVSKMKRESTEL